MIHKTAESVLIISGIVCVWAICVAFDMDKQSCYALKCRSCGQKLVKGDPHETVTFVE